MNDYQVGYSFVPFKGPAGHYAVDGGTVVFSNEARMRNSVRNSATIFEVYGPHAERIDAMVAAANAALDPSPPEVSYWSTPAEAAARARASQLPAADLTP
jgi:hypothetical protein